MIQALDTSLPKSKTDTSGAGLMTTRVRSLIRGVFHRVNYRVIHRDKFPKGDLLTFCRNIARRGFYPRHIVDVGANKARWSGKARKIFPQATFTLIEPQIEMKPYLDRFCATAKDSRWINAGVGSANGTAIFTVHPDTVSSSFTNTKEEAAENGWQQREVPVITLDHLCTNVIDCIPEMVKVDAEGFEYEILKGAQTLFGKTELFLLELPFFAPRPQGLSFDQMIQIMADYGYKPYDFTTFQRRPYDGAPGLCELAFAKEQGILRSYHGW